MHIRLDGRGGTSPEHPRGSRRCGTGYRARWHRAEGAREEGAAQDAPAEDEPGEALRPRDILRGILRGIGN